MKEGNQLAFTLLFNEYSKQVYSLAFKYLYNRELAEDVVQNVFFKIWEKKNPAIKSINFVVQATEDLAVGMHNSSCRSLLKKIATSPAPQTVYQPGTGQAAAESAEYAYFGESGQSLSVPLNPQYTFDNFVVGKTN